MLLHRYRSLSVIVSPSSSRRPEPFGPQSLLPQRTEKRPQIYGEPWLSWLWIDTKSASSAEQAVKLAKAAGTPIRAGGLGYDQPSMIRMAVRAPDKQVVLFKALGGIVR